MLSFVRFIHGRREGGVSERGMRGDETFKDRIGESVGAYKLAGVLCQCTIIS
jgi:hypothetical protein